MTNNLDSQSNNIKHLTGKKKFLDLPSWLVVTVKPYMEEGEKLTTPIQHMRS